MTESLTFGWSYPQVPISQLLTGPEPLARLPMAAMAPQLQGMAPAATVTTVSGSEVVRIGDYVVGDEECPLLYGLPGMRY